MNTSPLNVLQIYYEPAPAGQTRHVFALVQALAPRHHVTVVLPDCLLNDQAAHDHGLAWTDMKANGVQLVPLPMRKLLWPRATLLAFARLVRREPWQIVHVHSQEAGLCGRLTGWLASIPRRSSTHIVYTPQTIDIRRSNWHRVYRLLERLMSNTTSAVISVNEADRRRLIGWGISPARVVTIPNGIDLEASQDLIDPLAARDSLGLDRDRPVVMQVARLSPQKNPLGFVEGAALVARQRPDVQFAMIGQGPLKEIVTSRIQALGLKEHIRLIGWRDQAHRFMSAADVITLTSNWEGSPYSLLEAMAASKPVVATAVNGCPEIVADGDSGFLTSPGDVSSWSAKVIHLIEQPALAIEMGKTARRRAEQRFSIQSTTIRTEQLYQRLANGNCSAQRHA